MSVRNIQTENPKTSSLVFAGSILILISPLLILFLVEGRVETSDLVN
jgi:hypothetical protein